MKDYELTVVFHPDLEMNIDPALEKVKKIIQTNGGKITKEEADGKKRLAYPINGQEFAVYYYFEVALPPEAPSKISSTFNITDEIMRHLLVRTDEHKAKIQANADQKSAKESTDEKGE